MRYKAAHGGRGSGKSHFFADSAVDDALRFPGDYGEGLRMVCIREVQKDLKESSKLIIEDKLRKYGVADGAGFRIFKDCIETPGDGIIIFRGMNDYNADSIKSLEGFHRSWTEEAHTMRESSLRMLRPTLRWEDKRGGESELWFSWNPFRKNDPVDVVFRNERPDDSIVIQANWKDNPWFPDVLERERQDCLKHNPEEYDHIWEGGYFVVKKGAYYAKSLVQAKQEGRICRVSADPYLPYQVFTDIGGTSQRSDSFVMWIVQWVGREIRVLNYYEAVGQEFKDHLAWLRNSDYTPDNAHINLPHDGATNDKVHRVSYESAFKSAGYKVVVHPNQGTGAAKTRIEAARRRFPMCWFNEDTTTAGREALGAYQENVDEKRQIGLGPLHNWASHGADAFGEMCIAYKEPRPHGAGRPRVRTSTRGLR